MAGVRDLTVRGVGWVPGAREEEWWWWARARGDDGARTAELTERAGRGNKVHTRVHRSGSGSSTIRLASTRSGGVK